MCACTPVAAQAGTKKLAGGSCEVTSSFSQVEATGRTTEPKRSSHSSGRKLIHGFVVGLSRQACVGLLEVFLCASTSFSTYRKMPVITRGIPCSSH